MYVVPISITFLALSIVTVVVRLYTRLYLVRTAGWDDLVISIALLSEIGCFVFIILEVHHGLGKSLDSLSPETVQAQLKALWASIPLYNLSLNLTKASMVILYLRLFPLKNYQIILVIVLVFVILSGLWMVFGSFFMCIPVRGFWDTSISHSCISRAVMWSLNAALQIVTDMIIVILPMPLLTKLQLPKRQKIALIIVFALGTFVCAVSIVRLAALIRMIRSPDQTRISPLPLSPSPFFVHSYNKLEHNAAAANWSFIEASVAIICASLPPLRPFIVRIFPRIFLSQVSSERDKPRLCIYDTANPFRFPNLSFSASVTGNCSTNNDGREPSTHRHPDAEGIQVVSEVHWDLNSADSKDDAHDAHSQRRLQPSARSLSLSRS
ncbi:hypothetical protein BBP40_002478 [Aspergillus hancockii]|nr:hypothetical protein BBP40_002478 [Aspergillus hancockii]